MATLLIALTRHDPLVPQLAKVLTSRLRFAQPEIATAESAEVVCRNANPELILIAATEPNDRILELVHRLRAGRTGNILVVGPAANPKWILRTLQAGADQYLDQAELETELETALSKLEMRVTDSGEVLAVLSTSGGCGASSIAANLAVVLARNAGECNLIDLNPGKADLSPLFDLKPQYTLVDLCRNADRMDRLLYEKVLTPHPSGVVLLAAPPEFDGVEHITSKGVAGALELARSLFAHSVVDLKNCCGPEQLAVLGQAKKIFLITRLDFTAIRNLRRMVDHLVSKGIPRERIEPVVNHLGQADELPVEDAEFAIGGKLTRFIPYDAAVMRWANNTGIPAAIGQPLSPVVQKIASLVDMGDPNAGKADWSSRLKHWMGKNAAAIRGRFAKRDSTAVPVPVSAR